MKENDWLWLILLLFLIFSWLPIIPEPYHHKEKVNFWMWTHREYDELLHGEAE